MKARFVPYCLRCTLSLGMANAISIFLCRNTPFPVAGHTYTSKKFHLLCHSMYGNVHNLEPESLHHCEHYKGHFAKPGNLTAL